MVYAEHDVTSIHEDIIEPDVPDISNDQSLEARLGYAVDYLRTELTAVQRPETISDARAPQSVYVGWSPFVHQDVVELDDGSIHRTTHLTETGLERARELEDTLGVSTIRTKEDYLALKHQLEIIKFDLAEHYQEESDTAVVKSRMASARSILSEVRAEGDKALNRDKLERQALARDLISMAVAHLGLASQPTRENFDSISEYLKGYYQDNKSEENLRLVATARALVQARLRKGEQLFDIPPKPVERAVPKEQAITRTQRLVLAGGVTMVAAGLAIGAELLMKRQAIAHAAGKVDSLPTVTIPTADSQNHVVSYQAEAQPVVRPVEITQSGPVDYNIVVVGKNGKVENMPIGVNGVDPQYTYYTSPKRYRGLKNNEVAAWKVDGVTAEYGHSAWSLRSLVFRPIVNVYGRLLNRETGKMTDDAVYFSKIDKNGNIEYAKVVAWVKVPARITSTRQYIAYLRSQLPKGTVFDGYRSTCLIPEGVVVGNPQYFLAAVTVRVTPDQLPAEMKPHSPNDQGIEMTYADDDREQGETAARNPLKSKNPLTIWQQRQARLQRQLARR